MGFFRLFNITDGGIVRDPRQFKLPKTRTIEKAVKQISPEAGKTIEKINNACDTLENFSDSIKKETILIKVVQRVTGLDKVMAVDTDDAKKYLKKGDHIKVQRLGYSHHGIYDGDNGVYHYDEGIVHWVGLKEFACNDRIEVVNNEITKYTCDEIVARARSRLGEQDYNLFFNNCENFATWCRIGEK